MIIEEKNGIQINEQLKESYMAKSYLTKESEHDVYEDQDHMLGEGFYRLAKVFYDKAELDTAEEYFLKALDKSQYPKDSFTQFKIYGFLIRIYSESLQEAKAEKFIELTQDLVEELGVDLGSLGAEYFYNVGMAHNYKGEFENALENFKIAWQKSQLENEPELIAKSLFSMSSSSYNLRRHNESLSHLNQLKELLEILKKGYLKGSMHMLYGNIYRDLGKFYEAMEHYDKAISCLQQKNCWNLYGYILLGKGIVLKKKGEYNQSLIYFNLALNSVSKTNFKRLFNILQDEVEDVNDSSVDLYLDRHNRVIHEKTLGTIDFKHRFVLLEILFLLAKNAGSHYDKDDLAKLIWKDEYNPLIHDKLIYTSISRLRKLIEPKGTDRKYILRGKDGYTFNPRVNARFYKEDASLRQKIIGNVEISSPV